MATEKKVTKAAVAQKATAAKAAAPKKAATAAKAAAPKKAATAAKAAAPKKAATAAKAAAPKRASLPTGYKKEGRILVRDSPSKQKTDNTSPKTSLTVVAPTALQKGIEKAREEISIALDGINELISSRLEISEAELSISFNGKGEFLGFGVGGAFSLKIKVKQIGGEN